MKSVATFTGYTQVVHSLNLFKFNLFLIVVVLAAVVLVAVVVVVVGFVGQRLALMRSCVCWLVGCATSVIMMA